MGIINQQTSLGGPPTLYGNWVKPWSYPAAVHVGRQGETLLVEIFGRRFPHILPQAAAPHGCLTGGGTISVAIYHYFVEPQRIYFRIYKNPGLTLLLNYSPVNNKNNVEDPWFQPNHDLHPWRGFLHKAGHRHRHVVNLAIKPRIGHGALSLFIWEPLLVWW